MTPLAELARTARIVVCCGSGGVGKTSTAAAVALWAAEHGRRTCVLTIDPARRLAQALGLDLLSNSPRPVKAKGLPARGPGSLDAMMLDMRRTFDEVIERYAGDAEQADRILANRFYQRLSSTLAGTQEYMAMEKLYELHESQRYDLLVVDTPPTRSALDFLDAPDNLNELLDARAFRLLIAPAQRIGRGYLRGLNLATTAMTKMVRRVTGSELLAEVGEFFAAFEGMYDGFKERAGLVYDQLKHPSTAFVVVATPDGAALREAAYFAGRLAADRMPLGALVVNRIHQAGPVPPVPVAARGRLRADGADGRLLADLLELHDGLETLAAAEQRRVRELLNRVPNLGVVQVPLLSDDVHDLPGLRRLGEHLFADLGGVRGEDSPPNEPGDRARRTRARLPLGRDQRNAGVAEALLGGVEQLAADPGRVVAAGVDPEAEAQAAGALAQVLGEQARLGVVADPLELGRGGQQELPGPGRVLAVGDLEQDLDPAPHGGGGVGHDLGEQQLVGDQDQLAVGGAQPGRPDPDLLHLALGLGDGDVVALGEGVLQQQDDAGGEVADDVLEGEPEGHRGQAEAPDQDREVDPAQRQGDHQPDRDRGVVGQGGHHHLDVALGPAPAQRPDHPRADQPGHHHGEHEGDHRGQQVGQPVDEPLAELPERLGQALQRQRTPSS